MNTRLYEQREDRYLCTTMISTRSKNRLLYQFNLVLILLLLMAVSVACQSAPEDVVHPLVGTQGEGQTYPAVGVPFAMTHWTPQTRAGETKCIAPYYFTDSKIQGFRGSHFLSGSCVPDYGSMTIMPGEGTLKTDAVSRASTFTRNSEHASPYQYEVDLADAHTRAQITGTLRSGMMRFEFTHDSDDAWIVVENNSRGGDGWIEANKDSREVIGQVPVRREYAGTGKLAGFSGYFVIQIDNPISTAGTWVGSKSEENKNRQEGDDLPVGVVKVAKMMTSTGGASAAAMSQPTSSTRPGFGVHIHFGHVRKGQIVLVRIGTSFTSVDEARKNLSTEIPKWNFETVEAAAKAEWHHTLQEVDVKDDSPARTIFYTALYHAFLHPRTYSDVSGSYPRFASQEQVAHANGFVYYDDFSVWDTFRAQHPLLTILEPARDSQMIRSLVAKGVEGGFLPIFPAWNSYTSEMVGDHASVMIIDAYRKGIRGFDINSAYALMRKNATEIPTDRAEYLNGKGRRGLDSYLKYGYIPLEDHIDDAFHKNEQVSRTLEYAYDDAMIAQMAATLGKKHDAELFKQHGENWRNVIDPVTGFARGRHADGSWATPFDPTQKYSWITEGTPWQYTFFVLQNVPGLVALEGGRATFIAKLDRLFGDRYYEHGNEPSHHIAYLYDAVDARAKTQRAVRSLMKSEYRDGPAGLAGNDDAGQMSAWYVMSALGFYEVCPGIPEYWLGSPRFDDVEVNLPNGRKLHILAKGASAGKVLVKSVILNGKPLAGYTLTHEQIAAGGTLQFDMMDDPDLSRK